MMLSRCPNEIFLRRADQSSDAAASRNSWLTVVVAGLDLTADRREKLREIGLQRQAFIWHNSRARPPFSYELLCVEAMDGSLLSKDRIGRSWHRPPYALPLRLARYAPLSTEAEVLDIAVISTQGPYREFVARVAQTAARLVQDAIVGCSRGLTGLSGSIDDLHVRRRWIPGSLDRAIAKLHTWLFSERWSVGMTTTPLSDVVRTGEIHAVTWVFTDARPTCLADPFPWPGTDRLLCEEMPVAGGQGRIVALRQDARGTWHRSVVLEEQVHHSYPCTVRFRENTYFLPEAPARGATILYRLVPDQQPIPLCDLAPQRRLADPTLFRHGDYYWVACTDLDIGTHDNLCLFYASELTGPWHPHRCTPAKIDICGARPAGPLFRLGTDLFRPGQDCARTYGARVVIHRIDRLTPDYYSETVVARLRPDPHGPFPDGLHTFAAGDGRVWIDGKRFAVNFDSLRRKLARRSRLALGNWATAR